jgi:hypothetical protein
MDFLARHKMCKEADRYVFPSSAQIARSSSSKEKRVMIKAIPLSIAMASTLLSTLLAPAAHAHHSFGEFDQQHVVELEGELKRVDWQNPHVHLELATADGGTWRLESAGTNMLVRMGVPKGRLRTGQHVRVAIYPSRQTERYGYTANLLPPDGVEIVLFRNVKPRWKQEAVGFGTASDQLSAGSSTSGQSARNSSLFGVWGSDLSNPDSNPAALARGAEAFPYTAAGRERREAWLRTRRAPVAGCTPKGMPLIMEQPFPIQFVDRGRTIELRLEEYDVVRTIHLDAARAARSAAPRPLGHSIGKWEGATLIVETVGAQGEFLDQHGTPQGREALLVERFTPAADGRRLDYVLLVTDPEVFTRPVEMRRAWFARPEKHLLPFRCKP